MFITNSYLILQDQEPNFRTNTFTCDEFDATQQTTPDDTNS